VHVCERHQIATCLPMFIHLVLAPPQPAVTLERAQTEETTGEVTQDDGSQYCESVVACLLPWCLYIHFYICVFHTANVEVIKEMQLF